MELFYSFMYDHIFLSAIFALVVCLLILWALITWSVELDHRRYPNDLPRGVALQQDGQSTTESRVAVRTWVREPQRYVRVINCSDPMYWYWGMNDRVFPVEHQGFSMYWTREPGGFTNFILQKDATLLTPEEVTAWKERVRASMEARVNDPNRGI